MMRQSIALACIPFCFVALTIPFGCGSSDSGGNDAGSGSSGGGSGSSGAGSGGTSSGGSGGTSSSGGSGGTSSSGGSGGTSSSGSGGSSGGAGSGSSSGGSTSSSGGSGSGGAGASVLMHHNHINRDGFFVDAKLTKAAAATMHNDPGFKATITGKAYATPLFLEAGKVPALNGGKGAVFVATETNDVYALDEATGTAAWHVNLGNPGGPGCGNGGKISPQGVTGTPAIDLASGLIVMDSAQGGGTTKDHVVFGLDLATGMTKWQVSLNGTNDANNHTFNAPAHVQRPAALIANNYAYFGYAGNIGDCGSYAGWVIGVPLDGNKANVKAWRPDDSKSGVWGPGGPSSDGNSIFVATGNGSGPTSWSGSEGIIRLGFDLSFTKNAMDYYAPSDFANLDGSDRDISGSGPLVIDTPGGGGKLILALGKNGDAYLIDSANMGGVGGNLVDRQTVSSGQIANAAAWANIGGSVYVVANNNWTGGSGCAMGSGGDLFAIKIDSSKKMTEVWCGNSGGHSSPIITSSDGSNDAIAWVGGGNDSAGGGGAGDGKLHGFDLLTGTEIPNTASIPNMAVLSSSLIAANGRIYAASNKGTVYAVTP